MNTFLARQSGALTLAVLLTTFSACNLLEKKKDETPKPEETINSDTLALKTGKGFSQMAIIPSQYDGSTGANGGFSDGISFFDMTLDPDGKTLYIGASSRLSTQQDPMISFARMSLNMENGQMVATPTTLDINSLRRTFRDLSQPIGVKLEGFKPGTNSLYFGSVNCDNFGICTASMTGAFSYNKTYTFVSTPRVTEDGVIIETGRHDNHSFWAPTWRQRIYCGMTNQAGSKLWMQSITTVPNRESAIFQFAFEPKGLNSKGAWFFGANSKRMYVGEVEFALDNLETPIVYLDSLDLPTGFAQGLNIKVQTRVSADKSKIGILLASGETHNKVCSYVLNTNTKKLSQNIQNLSIPDLSSGNIDTDLDENGNLYFDGWADNFRSDSTISIYKASGETITSIGENLLKSGSIKGIRYLNGKVYAALVYAFRKQKVQGAAKFYRLAILRQD